MYKMHIPVRSPFAWQSHLEWIWTRIARKGRAPLVVVEDRPLDCLAFASLPASDDFPGHVASFVSKMGTIGE